MRGSPWFFSGERNRRWPDRLVEELRTIPADAFEAVDARGLMVSRTPGKLVRIQVRN